jgi:hypothetical protein
VTGGDEHTAWLVMERNDVLKVEGSSMENLGFTYGRYIFDWVARY